MDDEDFVAVPKKASLIRMPASCKQNPKLIQRVTALANEGYALSDIDKKLSSEGYTNSVGKIWPTSTDGRVLQRIIAAAGLKVPPRSSAQSNSGLPVPSERVLTCESRKGNPKKVHAGARARELPREAVRMIDNSEEDPFKANGPLPLMTVQSSLPLSTTPLVPAVPEQPSSGPRLQLDLLAPPPLQGADDSWFATLRPHVEDFGPSAVSPLCNPSVPPRAPVPASPGQSSRSPLALLPLPQQARAASDGAPPTEPDSALASAVGSGELIAGDANREEEEELFASQQDSPISRRLAEQRRHLVRARCTSHGTMRDDTVRDDAMRDDTVRDKTLTAATDETALPSACLRALAPSTAMDAEADDDFVIRPEPARTSAMIRAARTNPLASVAHPANASASIGGISSVGVEGRSITAVDGRSSGVARAGHSSTGGRNALSVPGASEPNRAGRRRGKSSARSEKEEARIALAIRRPQDGERCAFCGEHFQRWGAHVLCSAPCGHTFGEVCSHPRTPSSLGVGVLFSIVQCFLQPTARCKPRRKLMPPPYPSS